MLPSADAIAWSCLSLLAARLNREGLLTSSEDVDIRIIDLTFVLYSQLWRSLAPKAGRAGPVPDDIMLLLPLTIWCRGPGWIVLASGMVVVPVAMGINVVTLTRRYQVAAPMPPACGIFS